MNPLIQLKKATPVFFVALACFGFLPTMRAVTPAPDGGYPGRNTAEGQAALLSLTTGGLNTAVGFASLRSLTTGSFNTAIGAGALLANTANQNTATGAGALLSNIGFSNTANGAFALVNNTMGVDNTAIGVNALIGNTIGDQNTAIGVNALSGNTSGFLNIALGFEAGTNVTTADHVICIGAPGANVENSCFIGDIYGTATQSGTTLPVIVSDQGQLGTASSSRRFKTDIKPIDRASESILALKPVSFRYKTHKDNTPQFGLIAEEVAAVNPDLVVRDKNGEIYTVRYEAVNAMLLNEFLKEHHKVEQQEGMIAQVKSNAAKQDAIIAKQQKQIDALTAGLKKVSAQLELSEPVPQTVLDNE
jgi:uncharacterized coiled-coil protein SlyX